LRNYIENTNFNHVEQIYSDLEKYLPNHLKIGFFPLLKKSSVESDAIEETAALAGAQATASVAAPLIGLGINTSSKHKKKKNAFETFVFYLLQYVAIFLILKLSGKIFKKSPEVNIILQALIFTVVIIVDQNTKDFAELIVIMIFIILFLKFWDRFQ
jgi:hypothetical protein